MIMDVGRGLDNSSLEDDDRSRGDPSDVGDRDARLDIVALATNR